MFPDPKFVGCEVIFQEEGTGFRSLVEVGGPKDPNKFAGGFEFDEGHLSYASDQTGIFDGVFVTGN